MKKTILTTSLIASLVCSVNSFAQEQQQDPPQAQQPQQEEQQPPQDDMK